MKTYKVIPSDDAPEEFKKLVAKNVRALSGNLPSFGRGLWEVHARNGNTHGIKMHINTRFIAAILEVKDEKASTRTDGDPDPDA